MAAALGAIGILTAISMAFFFSLGQKIDGLGARIDAQGTELRARIDAQGADLGARIDAQGARIDAVAADLGRRIEAQGARLDARIAELAGGLGLPSRAFREDDSSRAIGRARAILAAVEETFGRG